MDKLPAKKFLLASLGSFVFLSTWCHISTAEMLRWTVYPGNSVRRQDLNKSVCYSPNLSLGAAPKIPCRCRQWANPSVIIMTECDDDYWHHFGSVWEGAFISRDDGIIRYKKIMTVMALYPYSVRRTLPRIYCVIHVCVFVCVFVIIREWYIRAYGWSCLTA